MNSLVAIKNKNVVTDSLIVAYKFGKRHDSVIRKIENLIKDDESTRLIFVVSEYKDSTGRFLKKFGKNSSTQIRLKQHK